MMSWFNIDLYCALLTVLQQCGRSSGGSGHKSSLVRSKRGERGEGRKDPRRRNEVGRAESRRV